MVGVSFAVYLPEVLTLGSQPIASKSSCYIHTTHQEILEEEHL
jgi:hypothetical protein